MRRTHGNVRSTANSRCSMRTPNRSNRTAHPYSALIDMDRKVCVSVLLAMIVSASISRPMTEVGSARHGALKKSTFSGISRRDLMASLSHDQRKMMSQLLPELYAELSTAESHFQPMQDRDYAGWMDFGRRSSEDFNSDS
uniref:Gastrin/cholecystokinin peptide hormone domain-containing protein n=1 Tax=Leptobrachium leishanense TaxID=445787 RepID=A0A8C5Q9V3_9ANUR